MSTIDNPTLSQVLSLARRLPATDQVQLIAQLTPTITAALEVAQTASVIDPYTTLAEIREAFRKQGPVSPSMAEELEASRNARDQVLAGRGNMSNE